MRETKADLKIKAEAAEKRATITMLALQCVASDRQPDATASVTDSETGEGWEFSLYRVHSSHGGILVETWNDGGGRSYVTAYYFEDYYREASRKTRLIGGDQAHAISDALSRLGMRAQAIREGLV